MYTKHEVAQLAKKQREISQRGLSAQYDNTDACFSFYDGDAMNYKDKIEYADTKGRKKRAVVNFNKVQSNVDAVVGFMAQNRRQAKFIARVNASEGQSLFSRYMNAVYSYHRENSHADQLETEQDADMMIGGYGATDTDLSYLVGNATTNPNGEIIKIKLDPKRTYWDPQARGANLLDARWAGYFEDYDLMEALELFEGSKKEDFEEVGDAEGTDEKGYTYNPYGGLYDKIKALNSVEWTAKDQDMVRVYNHQWMVYETFYKAVNPLYLTDDPTTALFMQARLSIIQAEIEDYGPDDIKTQDLFKFDPSAKEFVFDEKTRGILVKEFGDMIDPIPFKRKCFYTAVFSGEHVFTFFKSISQQGFSIKFKTGVYNRTLNFWMGMVNAMMEPQKYYNKALTELMFTIAANSKGGVMVEEDAVEDLTDFSSKWAKTDAVIKVSAGAISSNKIQQKAQGAIPSGLENIITLSDASISAAGVGDGFLGNMDRDDQSGILYKRRIRQVISKMARYMDSISLYQKEDARLNGDLIPAWVVNNEGALVRIGGEDGADEFMRISEDALAPEYDVTIQEAPQTPEDQQETAVMLASYGDRLLPVNPQAAQGFYAESLQQMTSLDGEARNRLITMLQPKEETVPIEQYKQLEQQLQSLMSEMQQAEVEKSRSTARLNDAKTNETLANIEQINSKLPLANAQTAKTLEEARRTAAEVDFAHFNPENVNVNL